MANFQVFQTIYHTNLCISTGMKIKVNFQLLILKQPVLLQGTVHLMKDEDRTLRVSFCYFGQYPE